MLTLLDKVCTHFKHESIFLGQLIWPFYLVTINDEPLTLSPHTLFLRVFPASGWVPSIHRGTTAPGPGLCLHLVQPAGQEEEVLQEAREEDDQRRRESSQGRAAGWEGGGKWTGVMELWAELSLSCCCYHCVHLKCIHVRTQIGALRRLEVTSTLFKTQECVPPKTDQLKADIPPLAFPSLKDEGWLCHFQLLTLK